MSIQNPIDLLVEEAAQVAAGQSVLLDRDDLLDLISRLAGALRDRENACLAAAIPQSLLTNHPLMLAS